MNTNNKNPGNVVAAPRRPRSAIIFGEESLLAPKARFEISVDESHEDSARLAAVHAKVAESNARRVLESVAAEGMRRTIRFPNSPLVWVQAGLADLAEGNYEASKAKFGKALELDPASRSARLGLARVLNETEQGRQAIEILRALRSENLDDFEVLVALGVVTSDVEGASSALPLFDREPEVSARSAPFFAARGSLRVATGDYKGAIADLRKVVRLKSDWVQARNALGIAELKSGHALSAERRFREVVRVAPMYLEGFLNLLRVMLTTKRYREALDSAIERFPNVSAAPGPVGRIASQAALELGEWSTAKLWLQSAIPKVNDPAPRARLLNDLGVTYSRIGKHKEAEQHFAESVEAFETELAIVNRGKALLHGGRPLEAVEWLQSANCPDGEPSANRTRTLAIALEDARLHEASAATYEKLIASKQADVQVYRNLTALYTDTFENRDRAVETAFEGLAQFASDPILVNNLAYALLMAGQVEQAATVLGMPIVPANDDLLYLTATRGLLELLRGDINAGRRLYDEALALSQTDATRERVRSKRDLEVGRAMIRLGNSRSEAASLLQRAAEAGDAAYPYDLHAKTELKRLLP